MSETELQATIKRMQQEQQQMTQQFQMLQQGYFSVGNTFCDIARQLLLAIGDPDDKESMDRAKKHAKEAIKHWDLALEMRQKSEDDRQKQQGQLIELPKKEIISPS